MARTSLFLTSLWKLVVGNTFGLAFEWQIYEDKKKMENAPYIIFQNKTMMSTWRCHFTNLRSSDYS